MANFAIASLLALLIYFRQCCGASFDDIEFIADSNYEFDLLIFTQQWPVTTCMEWMETSKSHECLLPSPKEIWTIHGVWPTRFGTIGPAFCNTSAHFNPDELKPFEDQLEQFWINVEKGQQLWKHEWLKHGTCAMVLPELSNENKYFGQGLSWLQQYSMSSILQKGGITPDRNHTLITIHQAVTNALKRNPSIHCIQDHHDLYLSEIRICFNKSLNLVDCDGVVGLSEVAVSYPGGTIITNCDLSKPIQYPSVVPSARIQRQKKKADWQFPFVNVYKLLELVKWLTL